MVQQYPELLVVVDPNCPNQDPIRDPARPGDSGYDLVSWVDNKTGVFVLEPNEKINIRTGASIKIPDGYFGDIRPRSSTFARKNLLIMHATIDEQYTGEISYFVWNGDDVAHTIKTGDRLAQLIILPRCTPPKKYVKRLPKTIRNTKGFGSTGC